LNRDFPNLRPDVCIAILALQVFDIPFRQSSALGVQRRRDRHDVPCEEIQFLFDTVRMSSLFFKSLGILLQSRVFTTREADDQRLVVKAS